MRNTLLLLVLTFNIVNAWAQDITYSEEIYRSRQKAYRDNALANFTDNAIVIQAYEGQPVDPITINRILDNIYVNGEFDFNLVQLVRILNFSNGEYEQQLLPAIQSIPLWLTPNEKTRVYWSENHITMWLSSAWLLKEKYGWDNDPELRKKLVHCLDLKINYGFYEFFSSVYFPYSLSGLLNLVDFAKDPEIKEKAVLATNRLLKDVMLLVNDKGGFFPAAGRNYRDKYNSAYRQNHSGVIYLLTGFGEVPVNATHAAAFLATSSFDIRQVVESWSAKENKLLKLGHSITEGFSIHGHLLKNDRIIFQWSGGAYFHPDVALETATLIDSYNMWEHKEFKPFKDFKGLPPQLAPAIATVAASLSRSSVYSKADIAIFKDHSLTLSSVQDYWKGRAGFQQWPWAATTGTIGVTTQSGNINNALGEEDLSANSTLPYLEQKDNVALIMYRANKDLALFGFDKHDVRLFWKENEYDEVAFEGKWIIGREGDSYVAVLRHCTDVFNGEYACDDQDGQLWGVIVGNDGMYGSFEHFREIVRNAGYKEEWIFDAKKLEWIYYGMIDIDGKKIEHYWNGNLLSAPRDPSTVTGVQYNVSNKEGFNIYPNPAGDYTNIQLMKLPASGNLAVHILDISGREVYHQLLDRYTGNTLLISTAGWASGMYTVLIETAEGAMSKKMIVQNQK